MGEATTQGHQMAHDMAQATSAPIPPQQSQSSSSSSVPVVSAPVVSPPQQQIMGEETAKPRRGRPPKVIQTIGDKQPRSTSRPTHKQLPQIPTRQTPPPIPEVTLDAIMEDTKPQSVPPLKARSKRNIPAVADEPMPESKKETQSHHQSLNKKQKQNHHHQNLNKKQNHHHQNPHHHLLNLQLWINQCLLLKRKKGKRASSEPPETEIPPILKIPPSKAGIQILYEVLQNAKNKKNIICR